MKQSFRNKLAKASKYPLLVVKTLKQILAELVLNPAHLLHPLMLACCIYTGLPWASILIPLASAGFDLFRRREEAHPGHNDIINLGIAKAEFGLKALICFISLFSLPYAFTFTAFSLSIYPLIKAQLNAPQSDNDADLEEARAELTNENATSRFVKDFNWKLASKVAIIGTSFIATNLTVALFVGLALQFSPKLRNGTLTESSRASWNLVLSLALCCTAPLPLALYWSYGLYSLDTKTFKDFIATASAWADKYIYKKVRQSNNGPVVNQLQPVVKSVLVGLGVVAIFGGYSYYANAHQLSLTIDILVGWSALSLTAFSTYSIYANMPSFKDIIPIVTSYSATFLGALYGMRYAYNGARGTIDVNIAHASGEIQSRGLWDSFYGLVENNTTFRDESFLNLLNPMRWLNVLMRGLFSPTQVVTMPSQVIKGTTGPHPSSVLVWMGLGITVGLLIDRQLQTISKGNEEALKNNVHAAGVKLGRGRDYTVAKAQMGYVQTKRLVSLGLAATKQMGLACRDILRANQLQLTLAGISSIAIQFMAINELGPWLILYPTATASALFIGCTTAVKGIEISLAFAVAKTPGIMSNLKRYIDSKRPVSLPSNEVVSEQLIAMLAELEHLKPADNHVESAAQNPIAPLLHAAQQVADKEEPAAKLVASKPALKLAS